MSKFYRGLILNTYEPQVKLTLTVVFFSVCWFTFSKISIKPDSEICQKRRKTIRLTVLLSHRRWWHCILTSDIRITFFLPFLLIVQAEPFEWDNFLWPWPSLVSPMQDCSLKTHEYSSPYIFTSWTRNFTATTNELHFLGKPKTCFIIAWKFVHMLKHIFKYYFNMIYFQMGISWQFKYIWRNLHLARADWSRTWANMEFLMSFSLQRKKPH